MNHYLHDIGMMFVISITIIFISLLYWLYLHDRAALDRTLRRVFFHSLLLVHDSTFGSPVARRIRYDNSYGLVIGKWDLGWFNLVLSAIVLGVTYWTIR